MAEKINILIGDKDYLMNLSNALSSSLGSCCEISSFPMGRYIYPIWEKRHLVRNH